MFNRLKKKWNIQSNWQIFVILLVFALTGTSSIYITKPALSWFGITVNNFSNPIIYQIIKIVLVLVAYQFLLLFWGTVLGQHAFFYNFLKRFLSRLGFLFLFKK